MLVHQSKQEQFINPHQLIVQIFSNLLLTQMLYWKITTLIAYLILVDTMGNTPHTSHWMILLLLRMTHN